MRLLPTFKVCALAPPPTLIMCQPLMSDALSMSPLHTTACEPQAKRRDFAKNINYDPIAGAPMSLLLS